MLVPEQGGEHRERILFIDFDGTICFERFGVTSQQTCTKASKRDCLATATQQHGCEDARAQRKYVKRWVVSWDTIHSS